MPLVSVVAPTRNRPPLHAEALAEFFREATGRRKAKPLLRPRLRIDETTATQVKTDVQAACRDVVRRAGYEIPEKALGALAEAAFVAVLNSLDVEIAFGGADYRAAA